MQAFLNEYLATYGYIVLFVGTLLEGEAILIMAGYLASQGYLNLYIVMPLAFVGAVIGDQFYFYLGRWQGARLLKLFTAIARKFRKALKLIEKYGTFVAFISRYTYGFRILLPIILGMSSFPSRKFFYLNVASAAVWAVLFSLAGYLFGKAVSLFIEDVEKYEGYVLLALVALIVLSWGAHFVYSWWSGKSARARLKRMKARQETFKQGGPSDEA